MTDKQKNFLLFLIIIILSTGCTRTKILIPAEFRNITMLDNREQPGFLLALQQVNQTISYIPLATLHSLPSVRFAYFDPWDKIEYECLGINLYFLLSGTGMLRDADYVTITAENNYSIPITCRDLAGYSYYLVYEINNTRLPHTTYNNKGSLLIAIDFKANPDMPCDIYEHQLVWQVADIQAGVDE